MHLIESGKKRSWLFYFLPSVCSALIPLVTIPVYANLLTRDEFGAMAIAQATATMVSSFSSFGLSASFERNYFKQELEKSKKTLLYTTLCIIAVTSTITSLPMYLFRSELSVWVLSNEYRSGTVLLLSYCIAVFLTLKSIFLVFFRNETKSKDYALYSVLDTFLGFIFSLIFALLMDMRLIGILLGQATGLIITLLILIFREFSGERPVILWSEGKEMLRIGLPLAPKSLFSSISSQLDKYLLSFIANLGQVGIYFLGQRIANAVNMFIIALQNIFSPTVYKIMFRLKDKRSGGKVTGDYLSPFFFISAFSALLVVLFSEEAISFLLPESYKDAIEVTILFAVANVTLFFGKQPQLIFSKKTEYISIISAIGVAVNFSINYVFIYKWGLIGAAWGTFVSMIFNSTLYYVISQRNYEISYHTRLVFIPMALLVSAAVGVILLRYFHSPLLMKWVLKICILSAYISLFFSNKKHFTKMISFTFPKNKYV